MRYKHSQHTALNLVPGRDLQLAASSARFDAYPCEVASLDSRSEGSTNNISDYLLSHQSGR